IANRTVSFAKEMVNLEVSRIYAGSVSNINNKINKPGKKVLIDFRPWDIISREHEIGNFDKVVLLLHNQDVTQLSNEDWDRFKNIIDKNKAVVGCTSLYCKEFLSKLNINVFPNIIRAPIRPYPNNINSRALQEIIRKSLCPSVLL